MNHHQAGSDQSRIGLLAISLCLFIGGVSGSSEVHSSDWPERPNIVFIIADDYGWRDVGCQGSRYYQTPRLDRLAEEGMRFTSAYSNAPNCAPTRACLMTGLYGPRHGIFTVGTSHRGDPKKRKLNPVVNTTNLDTGFFTLAKAMKQAGYKTAAIGKWHLGSGDEFGPVAHGFDVSIGGDHTGRTRSHFSPFDNPTLPEGPEGEYLTDRLTDEAVRYIEENQESPFFLYLAHYAVHTPIEAKEETIAKYRDRPPHGGQDDPVYAAMVESLDEGVGRVLDALDRLDLRRKTLVVFFSDNGGHGDFTSNAPLRGSKGMLYEGGIRVPMIVSLPGVIAEGSTSDLPVQGTDFFPTLLEVVGSKAPEEVRLDGRSYAPTLLGEEQDRNRSLYWHFPVYLEPYNRTPGPWRTTPCSIIRKGDWKLHEYFEDGRLELYNLAEDIGETSNLAEQEPDRVKELHEDLSAWRDRVNAPIPTELNPDFEG